MERATINEDKIFAVLEILNNLERGCAGMMITRVDVDAAPSECIGEILHEKSAYLELNAIRR